jgi:uncharacterized membrane protein YeiH
MLHENPARVHHRARPDLRFLKRLDLFTKARHTVPDFAPLVESRYRTLLWFDAFGLALVTVAGTVKASDVGAPALVAIAMGAVTGVVGGILRDTLGHVPSVLLGHEIHVTASVLGACTYVGLTGVGAGRFAAMIAGFLVTFTVRGLATKFGWSLPVFRETTKRERWKSERKDAARAGRRGSSPVTPPTNGSNQ